MIDEEYAFQMIHLMLKAGGQKSLQLFLMNAAFTVHPAGADHGRSLDLGELVGHRQAPFIIDRQFVRALEDLRIDEDQRVLDQRRAFLVRFGFLKVDDQHPLGHADLDRSQPDAGRIIHGLEHIVDQRLQIVVDRLDRGRNGAQPRIGRFKDGTDCHATNIGGTRAFIKRSAPFPAP